jgi:hypothetical protein
MNIGVVFEREHPTNAINREGIMRMIARHSTKLFALVVTISAFASTGYSQQEVIAYDNSSTNAFLGQTYGSPFEFGDQVNLAPGAWNVTQFKFDYYMNGNVSGNETADLKFYANDGPGGAPGTLLYDSGPFSLAKGYNTVNDTGLFTQVPNSFTWTVLFGGIEAFESAGLLFYNPPTTGSSADDYWQKDANGNWALQRFTPAGGPVANFGAQITAVAVPEPATVQLGLLGGLMWIGYVARQRLAAKRNQ